MAYTNTLGPSPLVKKDQRYRPLESISRGYPASDEERKAVQAADQYFKESTMGHSVGRLAVSRYGDCVDGHDVRADINAAIKKVREHAASQGFTFVHEIPVGSDMNLAERIMAL